MSQTAWSQRVERATQGVRGARSDPRVTLARSVFAVPTRITMIRPVLPPSLFSGMASALQLMPTLPARVPTIPNRDLVALQRSFQRASEHLKRAMEAFPDSTPSDLPQQERLFPAEDYVETRS